MNRALLAFAIAAAPLACNPDLDPDPARAVQALESAVPVAADTYLRNGAPNQNQGGEAILRIRMSGKNRALVRVDGAELAAAVGGDSLTSAHLEVTIVGNGENWGSGREVAVHRLTRSWTELGATWNCADDADTADQQPDCPAAAWEMGAAGPNPWDAIASDASIVTSGQSGPVAFDVTADVAAVLAGGDADGWIIKKTDENQPGLIELGSRESASPPRLVLVTEAQPVCSATPVTLYTGAAGRQMKADAANVYFSTPDGTAAAPADGSGPVTPLDGHNGWLAVDATHVYVADEEDGTVTRAPIGGGPVDLLASGGRPRGIAVNDVHVYWLDEVDSALKRTAKGGGAVEVIDAEVPGIGWMLQLDATYVYYTGYFSAGLFRMPLDGGAREHLTTVDGNATHLVLDGADAYVGANENNGGNAGVYRVAKGGGSPSLLAALGGHNPIGLVRHGDHLYWAELGGLLRRVPIDGSATAETLVQSGGQPSFPAVAGDTLFFDDGAGAVQAICLDALP